MKWAGNYPEELYERTQISESAGPDIKWTLVLWTSGKLNPCMNRAGRCPENTQRARRAMFQFHYFFLPDTDFNTWTLDIA